MALCLNHEGWGPASSDRSYDLTPCFEDAGLVGGSLALIFLSSLFHTYKLRKYDIQPKNVKTRKWLVAKLVRHRLRPIFPNEILTVVTTVRPLPSDPGSHRRPCPYGQRLQRSAPRRGRLRCGAAGSGIPSSRSAHKIQPHQDSQVINDCPSIIPYLYRCSSPMD